MKKIKKMKKFNFKKSKIQILNQIKKTEFKMNAQIQMKMNYNQKITEILIIMKMKIKLQHFLFKLMHF